MPVKVSADSAGFVTVFNAEPTGDLNLIYPDSPPGDGRSKAGAEPDVSPGRPLLIPDIVFEPAGRERCSRWGATPELLTDADLRSLVDRGEGEGRAYGATRNMRRVKEAMRHAGMAGGHVAALELERTCD